MFSTAFIFPFIDRFGLYGALAGTLTVSFLPVVGGVYFVRKSARPRPDCFLAVKSMMRFAVTAALLGVISWSLRGVFSSQLRWFLTIGPFFTLGYFLMIGFWSRFVYFSSAQSPRVLMVTQYLGLGGLERMILNLSIILKTRGNWRPHVFVYDHAKFADPGSHLGLSLEEAGIPVTYFSKSRGFSPKAVVKIALTILRDDISVLHTHDLGGLIYGVGAKFATFGRVRLVHTQHSFVHLVRKKRYQLYEKFFTYFANEITVVSADTRKTYVELGVPDRKIHIVPNGVQFPEYVSGETMTRALRVSARQAAIDSLKVHPAIAPLRAHLDSHWVLYMARLHGRKGQDQAMRVWGALDPRVRGKLTLLFLGLETEQGQAEKLRKLIEIAPDSSRILCLGPSHSPGLWLQSAEVFLSSSEFEGLPLASIEAAGAGLPLILSEIPGHASLKANSTQYPLGQPEQGARALERIIAEIEKSPDTFFKSAWNAAEPLRIRYSLSSMADAYSALYPWISIPSHPAEIAAQG